MDSFPNVRTRSVLRASGLVFSLPSDHGRNRTNQVQKRDKASSLCFGPSLTRQRISGRWKMVRRSSLRDSCCSSNSSFSTVADLSFLTWDLMIPWIFGEELESIETEKNYPNYYAWHQRLMLRPHVKKVLADKTAAKGHH